MCSIMQKYLPFKITLKNGFLFKKLQKYIFSEWKYATLNLFTKESNKLSNVPKRN